MLTPIDINYVYLPESTNNFIDQITPDNPLLRYSYEDHFIMRSAFSFYHSNKKEVVLGKNQYKTIFILSVQTLNLQETYYLQ